METNINEEIKKLQIELYKIQCRNWIPSRGKGTGAAGKTLEDLLGKAADRYVLPDYNGIEIKTKISKTYPMNLFSCACDNKPLEMKRLLDLGGYPDKSDPQFNVFHLRVNGLTYTDFGRYSYILSTNYDDERLDLIIRNRYTRKFVTSMSWSYKELKSRLTHKLNYLVYVPTKKEIVNEQVYFKYSDAKFYKLRSFRDFLLLIESGNIVVSFNIGYDKTPERYGQYKDKGTGFEIYSDDITKLFSRIKTAQ